MSSLHIYTHAAMINHDTGEGHPESPYRLRVLHKLFQTLSYPVVDAPEGTEEQVARVHPQEYIDALKAASPKHGYHTIDGDTHMSPGSLQAAFYGVGAVCKAVDDIVNNVHNRAFCAIRPPGHHAERAQAMGFCFFNNAFVAAKHAQATRDIQKVAIIDIDVHHGNGTDHLARDDSTVFYASTHQWPLFPGTGGPDDDTPDNVVNVPLSNGAGRAAFQRAYEDKIFPALRKFRPDLLIISAGFDAHKDDPLGGMMLEDEDFAWVTEELVKIAEECCQGRVLSALEGGYNLNALRSGVAAHLQALSQS